MKSLIVISPDTDPTRLRSPTRHGPPTFYCTSALFSQRVRDNSLFWFGVHLRSVLSEVSVIRKLQRCYYKSSGHDNPSVLLQLADISKLAISQKWKVFTPKILMLWDRIISATFITRSGLLWSSWISLIWFYCILWSRFWSFFPLAQITLIWFYCVLWSGSRILIGIFSGKTKRHLFGFTLCFDKFRDSWAIFPWNSST